MLIHSVSETPQSSVCVYFMCKSGEGGAGSNRNITFWYPRFMSGHLRKQRNSTKLEQRYGSVSAGKLKTNCLREVREKQRFLRGIVMQEE